MLTIQSDLELIKLYQTKKDAFEEQMKNIHKYKVIDSSNLLVSLGLQNFGIFCCMRSTAFSDKHNLT
jgi:hypothetical protein